MNVIESTRPSTKIQPPKRNNYVQYKGGGYIVQRIKYLIIFQTFFGINRLYLLGCRSCVKHFCFLYNAISVLIPIITIIVVQLDSDTQEIYKNTLTIEYIVLAICAVYLQKKPLQDFFSDLQSIDEKLNICEDIKLTSPIRFYVFGVIGVLLYCFYEYGLWFFYFVQMDKFMYSLYAASLGLVVHDVELIFFSVLLVMILRRLRVIKAHVAKVLCIHMDKEGCDEINNLEALSSKVCLDVSTLHNMYDLLHKNSQKLNSMMTVPMTVMLVTAGLSTILILKNLIYLVQKPNPYMTDAASISIYVVIGIGRALKYIALLVLPSYYANVTHTQVALIHGMLHDILNNNNQLDKVERRKLKAFSQLCQDNAFLYVMWGVVRLDMSLPLGYCSICTTYLIIFIQFSKFID